MREQSRTCQAAPRITSEDAGVEDRGHARTRARSEAAREALAAAVRAAEAQQAFDAANLVGSAAAGTLAGGVQRARPAASTMAVAPMPGMVQLLLAYTQFEALDANAKADFLNARRSFKPNTGPLPFVLGPGTLDSFTAVYEVVLELADLLLAGRFMEHRRILVTPVFSVLLPGTRLSSSAMLSPILNRRARLRIVYMLRFARC